MNFYTLRYETAIANGDSLLIFPGACGADIPADLQEIQLGAGIVRGIRASCDILAASAGPITLALWDAVAAASPSVLRAGAGDRFGRVDLGGTPTAKHTFANPKLGTTAVDLHFAVTAFPDGLDGMTRVGQWTINRPISATVAEGGTVCFENLHHPCLHGMFLSVTNATGGALAGSAARPSVTIEVQYEQTDSGYSRLRRRTYPGRAAAML